MTHQLSSSFDQPFPVKPWPPPLCSDEPGTWAYDTMSRRIRTDILDRIFRENSFTNPKVLESLKDLDRELAVAHQSKLRYIVQDQDSDPHEINVWNNIILKPWIEKGATWLSAPWLVTEFYFYRRVMESVGFFKEKMDPFEMQKELGITSAMESIEALASKVQASIAAFASSSPTASDSTFLTQFKLFFLASLWGNRMDLSIWPVGGDVREDAFSSVLEAGQKMILADHSNALSQYGLQCLNKNTKGTGDVRMDIVVDNAGFELFCDLCLADFLIHSKAASHVVLRLKGHPTYVSDAMAKDVMFTIHHLLASSNFPNVCAVAQRWNSYVEDGRWKLEEHYYWAQPFPYWEMPPSLACELRYPESALVFMKGDANYRRLLGDLQWPLTTPFADIASYFPAPLCALRTMKSELGCGFSQEQIEETFKQDSYWLVNGRFGVVQFVLPPHYKK